MFLCVLLTTDQLHRNRDVPFLGYGELRAAVLGAHVRGKRPVDPKPVSLQAESSMWRRGKVQDECSTVLLEKDL